MKRQPKFKVGERVTYKEDRRFRMVVIGCYWDADYPGWRYKFHKPRLRKDLQAYWAPIEFQLAKLPAKRKRA